MGYYKDLGTGTVHDVCPITKFPRDCYGKLLDPFSDNETIFEVGQELNNLTNPYGFLHFAIGDEDDFLCMDYATISTEDGKEFLIVDLTYNSETGCFIESSGYEVLPINTTDEKIEAMKTVRQIVGWAINVEVEHDEEGWGQEEDYFVRAVENHIYGWGIKDQQLRFSS